MHQEEEAEAMASSSAAVNLEDVPSVDLMTEVLRRMKCASKPDKRLILVGTYTFFCLYFPQVLIFILVLLSDPKILCV